MVEHGNDITNNQQLDEIKKLLNSQNSELKIKIDKLEKSFIGEITKLNQKVDSLQHENKQLISRIEFLERKHRKNNILIFGLHSDLTGDELCEWIVSRLRDLLQVEVSVCSINNLYFLKGGKNPLVIEFATFLTKLKILKSCFKLKGKSIYISNDYSKQEREINKILVPHLRDARKKNLKASIRGGKLYVGDDVYTHDQLGELPKVDSLPISSNEEVFVPQPRLSISAPSTPRANIDQETFPLIKNSQGEAQVNRTADPITKTDPNIRKTDSKEEDKKVPTKKPRTISQATPPPPASLAVRASSRTKSNK